MGPVFLSTYVLGLSHIRKKRGLGQQLEGVAMVGSDTVPGNGGTVVGRGIAFVLGPAILGIIFI